MAKNKATYNELLLINLQYEIARLNGAGGQDTYRLKGMFNDVLNVLNNLNKQMEELKAKDQERNKEIRGLLEKINWKNGTSFDPTGPIENIIKVLAIMNNIE